jgi:hypothetical protein
MLGHCQFTVHKNILERGVRTPPGSSPDTGHSKLLTMVMQRLKKHLQAVLLIFRSCCAVHLQFDPMPNMKIEPLIKTHNVIHKIIVQLVLWATPSLSGEGLVRYVAVCQELHVGKCGLFWPHENRGVSMSLRYRKIMNIIKPTLRLHEAAAWWNALCTVLLLLLQVSMLCRLAEFLVSPYLVLALTTPTPQSISGQLYCNVPDPHPKERVWLARL